MDPFSLNDLRRYDPERQQDGWLEESIRKLIADPDRRQLVIDLIVNEIEKENLDGV